MAQRTLILKFIIFVIFVITNHISCSDRNALVPSISEETTEFSNTDPELSGYFCPETIYESEFGTFCFLATSAANGKGNVATAQCPLGFRNDGAEPIYPTITPNIRDVKEAQSGARRACVLNETVDGNVIAVWEPESKIVVAYCRDLKSVELETNKSFVSEILNNPPSINGNTFRRALNFLTALRIAALKDYRCAETLVEDVGKILAASELYENEEIASQTRSLFHQLDKYATDAQLSPGYRVTVSSQKVSIQSARFSYQATPLHSDAVVINDYTSEIENVKIHLPAEAIKMSLTQGQEGTTGPKVKVTAYSDDLFFHWKGVETTDSEGNKLPPTTNNQSNYDYDEKVMASNYSAIVGNWRVFSVEIIGASIQNLTDEFEYTFFIDNGQADTYSWQCVFWNSEDRIWSSEGMRSFQLDNAVICKSTHLTAFSVLIDPLPLPFPGSDYAPINNSVHSHILSILSSLGSALSIVGLAGTILTYALFRCLRKERSNRILLNLSISLFFMHLISISSGKELWNEKCFVPSISLHYFLHTSLWWMLMEAYHMHQLLISVFVKPESRFLLKRAVVAWGIPLVIVGVCGAVRPEVYYTGRNDLCVIAAHLNLPLYYIAYLAPAVFILFINFFVFCRIFNVLYKQTKRQRKQSCVGKNKKTKNLHGKASDSDPANLNMAIGNTMKSKTKYIILSPTQIKGAVTVMILVGVGWVVGLLAIGPFEIFFKYLFCICNGGQGALIFLFRVLLHPQACRQWRKTLLGLTFDSTEVSTTSSTSLSGKGGPKRSFSASPSPNFISASNSVENSLTPSNPVAQDLAKTLASMLRESEGQNQSRMPL